jgi:hypothetical protein
MSNANFYVFFDGPALATGKMDVRELAPALLALGEIFEEANRVINQDRASIVVNVKSGFEKGSFGILIDLYQGLADQISILFSREAIATAANIAQVLGFMGIGGGASIGLLKLIKLAQGRRARRATRLGDGDINIEFDGDHNVVVVQPVYDVYRDMKVRNALSRFVKPLLREGITSIVSMTGEKEEVESIESGEAEYFAAPEVADEQIEESESVKSFSIQSLSFKGDNKWRLSDGTNLFWVNIKDEEFLRKVEENLVSFSKGDILRVKLKITQWETTDGLKTNYDATEILEHRSAARQIPLQIEEPPDRKK